MSNASPNNQPNGTHKELDSLIEAATVWLQSGHHEQASAAYEHSALIAGQLGDVARQAHSLCYAASAARLGGDAARAMALARASYEVAGERTSPGVAALVELGESAWDAGQPDVAAQAYADAIEQGRAEELPDTYAAAFMRRQARALDATGDTPAALELGREALAIYDGPAPNPDEAVQTAGELARYALLAGSAEADEVVADLRRRAAAVPVSLRVAEKVLAELELTLATLAEGKDDVDSALAHLRNAERHAREAVDALTFTSCSVALAHLSERLDNRVEAYRALVTGMSTLSDLVGAQIAEQSFLPLIQSQRQRWGEAAFTAAQEAYAARRNKEAGAGDQAES